jgi:SAM-dependent methyltransferase
LARADAKGLPFKAASFDRVLMLDIVEHLHEWELQEVWKEVRRVMAPAGLLIVHTLPNRWAVDYGYRLARLVLPHLPVRPPDVRPEFHVNEQSVASLAHSLARGGFEARVWVTDLLLEQADWSLKMGLQSQATVGSVYRLLQRPTWRALYRTLTRLPSRLMIATDVFAVAWPREQPPPRLLAVPRGLAERVVCSLAA